MQKKEELKGKIADTDAYSKEIERSYDIKSVNPLKAEKVSVDKANRL